MAKRCPPGVVCIENMTLIFLIVVVSAVVLYYFYISHTVKKERNVQYQQNPRPIIEREIITPLPPQMFSPPRNVLTNPYVPPMRDGGWFPDVGRAFRGGVPINMRTRGFDDSYRQVGLLTRKNGAETILPLMGRPLHANRNKWQFYTMSDNNVKLPVSRNGRSCTSEYGCDDLNNGDSIYIEGYNDTFNVTIYDNFQPRYIPYL
jgi:hypothetical protein